MDYSHTAIRDEEIPQAVEAAFQHAIDTYASETNKVASTWAALTDANLHFRPHPRSSTVLEILKHQLLSERRFFGEFLGTAESSPENILPGDPTVAAFTRRFVQLAKPRLAFLAQQTQDWGLERVPFFDVERERAWIFWRRVLHTAHHRTQLTVYLRLLEQPVPSTYGPTADVTWTGADPTTTIGAAGRK
jgi:uncharacterized damage-inducible protein DinB